MKAKKITYEFKCDLGHTSNDLTFVNKMSREYNKGFIKSGVDLFCRSDVNRNHDKNAGADVKGNGKFILTFCSNTFKTKADLQEVFYQYLLNK